MKVLHVVIDRTQWGCINLLMISVISDQRAIPIYFELLPNLGSSSLSEQKALLVKVLPLLKDYKKVVLGDREFCSVDLEVIYKVTPALRPLVVMPHRSAWCYKGWRYFLNTV